MSKKLNISQERRNQIKENLSKAKRSKKTTEEERRYIQLVENGKKSAKKNIRLNGKFVSGDVVDIVAAIAKQKKKPLQQYFNEQKKSIQKLIDNTFTERFKTIEQQIKLLKKSKRKIVSIYDGKETVDVKKKEAIKKLASMKKQISSGVGDIAFMKTKFRIKLDGKVRVFAPDIPEDLEGEEMEDFLDQYDEIEYMVYKEDENED